MQNEYILTLSCPDKVGIVNAVSGYLAHNGCNIHTSHQYGDQESNLFFMRVRFKTGPDTPDALRLMRLFEPVAA